jgi:uncharacterized protein YndB with AHSA1/START domain
MQKPSLTMTRRLKAPPATVFDAFTNPEKLAIWFGMGEPAEKVIEIDPRAGGRYHFGFPGMQTAERNDVMGVFKDVSPVEKLVFSWYWKSTPERESQVTVDLAPDGDGTLLTLTHEHFYDEAARDNHQMGWGHAMDQLQTLTDEPVAA